mmetsp:Transcript_2723/g.9886  ORF Transcript_2723/g.9886 Transcript_2723/m.9886 type:complete len:253 (-) Transcript_2723:173-931(-)
MSTSEASLIVSLLSASMIDGTEAAGEAVAEPSAAIATVDDEADSAAAPAVAIEGPLADAVVASSSAPEDADRDEQQEESLATEVEQLGDSLALPSLSLGTQIELDVANIHEPDCTEDEVLIHNMLPHEIHASERVTEPSIPPLEESIEEEFTNVVSHIQGSQSAVPGSQPHVFVWPYDAEKAELAGTFNGWTPEPMRKEGCCWVLRKTLPPGKHHFKYVINGYNWWIDLAKPSEHDGHTDNNVIEVGIPVVN